MKKKKMHKGKPIKLNLSVVGISFLLGLSIGIIIPFVFIHEKEDITATNCTGMYDMVVLPSVKIIANNAVGSGVIIHSELVTTDTYESYVLTAYHIVKAAVESKTGEDIKIDVYNGNKCDTDRVVANLLDYNVDIDIAILKFSSITKYGVARINTDNSIQILDKVIAVGCPIGYLPIPTEGIIACNRLMLGNIKYYLSTANMIFGSSGGGLFTDTKGELIGIVSMIPVFNYEGSRIPITFLGLTVSMETVIEWMVAKNLLFLVNKNEKV